MNANQDCMAYAGHLQAEHRAMHQRLREVQAKLNSVADRPIDEALRQQMLATGEQLLEELVAHFAEEDDGGCLEYAVSRVPTLAAEVGDIEAEHPQLLADLRRIVERLRNAAAGELMVADVKQAFDLFVGRLLQHEARESRVVERGLNLPIDY